MIEPEQIFGFGLIGGLLFLYSKIKGFKLPSVSVGSGNGLGIGAGDETEAAEARAQILSYSKTRPLSEEEVFQIADYMSNLLGGRVNQFDLMTFAYIESTFRPYAERYEPHIKDSSIGLMQVLSSTALDLYEKGYNDFGRPTRTSLKNPAISMYFGAAYIDWLKKYWPDKDLEWWVRAYNGGPGHNYNSQTTSYWQKWQAASKRFGGGSGVTITLG